MTTCPWWSRWWHQRLRTLDRRTIIPALLSQVPEDDAQGRIRIFALFTTDRGQAHWNCPCGQIETRDVLDWIV